MAGRFPGDVELVDVIRRSLHGTTRSKQSLGTVRTKLGAHVRCCLSTYFAAAGARADLVDTPGVVRRQLVGAGEEEEVKDAEEDNEEPEAHDRGRELLGAVIDAVGAEHVAKRAHRPKITDKSGKSASRPTVRPRVRACMQNFPARRRRGRGSSRLSR